mgnify:CR=1 FL=1
MGDPLFREHGSQVAALCWRAGPQVLLITSLTTRRWIIPKGWRADGMTPADAAAREALEEAGVTGKITLDARRNPTKPAVMLQVKNGKFAYVETIAP